MHRSIGLLPFMLLFAEVCAQPVNIDCASAQLFCADQAEPVVANNTGATLAPGFCPGTTHALWYTFTTNSQGGAVTVTVSDIDCLPIAGMDSTLSVVVVANTVPCQLPTFVNRSDCGEGDAQISVTSVPLAPSTQYWVLVAGLQGPGSTSAAQCGFSLDISGPGIDVVGVDFSAGPDVTIGEGESAQLSASGGPPYTWSPTSGLSGNGIPDPIASPAGTTIYAVSTTQGGCTYQDTVVVSVVRRIDPPNTFTPNGDGINDFWEVPGISDYPGAEVLIFDRWGQRVFRSNGYREPWDGTNGGKALSTGTYYYHILLNQLEGSSPPYTGFISIVR